MGSVKTVTVDGREVPIEGEKNLLELIRKIGIDIPTLCYVSELSVYGACRMCIVDIEGQGIQTSCSTPPEPGMKVRTNTEPVRQIRRMALELILANHERECTTCTKSLSCKLQELSKRLGLSIVRFRSAQKSLPINESIALVREPNKCILCGDCVRMCDEIQGIGAIDFAFRGHEIRVQPAFGKSLDEVQCVHCGQCARVCPTGALSPRSEVEAVWKDLHNPTKIVIAQIAPAVRVAIGEAFGYASGDVTTGQVISALKMMGFRKVYDTCFAADLTIWEEGNEFIHRLKTGGRLPMFTSCCPAWVKYVEQNFPDMLPHLSTCKSPQQMFGSLAKEALTPELKVQRENVVVVSIMPCVAKKFEAKRPEFSCGGTADVDHVITTQELVQMINESGLQFRSLRSESLDMPFGFKTGAGVIFGSSGGVTEAVLRYVHEKIEQKDLERWEFHEVRGSEGIREAQVNMGDRAFRFLIVHSLGNAKKVLERIRTGASPYDFVEVMSCPGGCINGGGQIVSPWSDARQRRAVGLYETDKALQLHKPQDNPFIAEMYAKRLGEVGGAKAHHLLHTHYNARRRIVEESLDLSDCHKAGMVEVKVCMGTSCYVRGAQSLLMQLARYVAEQKAQALVLPKAAFCFEACIEGPTVEIDGEIIHHCTLESALTALNRALESRKRSARAVREHIDGKTA
jgi:NADH-quinone oxidoreductase subunit G